MSKLYYCIVFIILHLFNMMVFMSSKEKTIGVVLGGFPFGESNKVIKILTEDLGLIKIVANGIRKTTSKYSGSLELMNLVSVQVRKSKSSDLFTLREFELLKSYHGLREDYYIISSLYYISEFISKFFENDVPNIEIYNLLILFLELLENNKDNINELRWGYLIKSLSILGYIPSLDKCSNCGKNLINNIYISSRDGWIFCYECMEHKIDKKISVGAINFLNIVLRNDYKEIIKLKVTDTVKNDLEEFFKSIIIGILGKGLKSEKMLYSI